MACGGPATFAAGEGMDVRPHPHIGLATLTYLLEGSVFHRDTLGSAQNIVPGDVNWMTAGRGIVHSERTPDEDRASGLAMHGIQTWVALPLDHEDTEPSFEHHAAATLPEIERNGVTLRVIAGTAFGKTAPVTTFSGTLYVAAHFTPGSAFALEPEHEERGVYLVEGDLEIDGTPLEVGTMAVLALDETVTLASSNGASLCLPHQHPGKPSSPPLLRHIQRHHIPHAALYMQNRKPRLRSSTFKISGGTTLVASRYSVS